MKGLVFCPNGERLTPREKLVGMVLADSHQDRAKSFTYPSVETIAEESLSDKRTCQRYLDALERKGVILRLRPKGQGRGSLIFYFFPALDVMPEGWQDAALSAAPLFAQKGGERVAEGWRKGGRAHISPVERAREREQEQKQQEQTPPNPLVAEGECGEDGNQVSADGNPERRSHDGETKAGAASLEADCVQTASDELEAVVGGRDAGDRGRSERADRRGDRLGQRGSVDGGVESAVDRVMQGCAFTARRLRLKIRAVVAQQNARQDTHREFESLDEIASAMIDAWKRYTSQGTRLRIHMNAARFFEEGFWLDLNSWHWDNATIREERDSAQARVGTWMG
jgi:hypothetical protein